MFTEMYNLTQGCLVSVCDVACVRGFFFIRELIEEKSLKPHKVSYKQRGQP